MRRLLFLGIRRKLEKLHLNRSLTVFLILLSSTLYGQPGLNLVDSISVSGELIAVDRLNQLYLLTEEDQLWKTDPGGEPQFQFSDNTLGPLTEIDVSNPFNILVFYRAYQLAKVLDRTLNPNIEFDFAGLNLFNVQSLTNGIDNTVWVYDQQEGKIFQLDANGNILNQSQDLVFITGSRPDSCRLFFHKNDLWLQVNEVGLLKFNAFGQFQRIFHWPQKIEQVAFWNGQLVFQTPEKWYLLESLQWEARPIELPLKELSLKIFFNNNLLFAQKENLVFLFRLSPR
jgi:hypothetical protein